MSKRSYRRLAVVAGAALAVGSMAPAMAAQVGATGTGSAVVDVSDVTIPPSQALIPGAFLTNAEIFASNAVSGAEELALDTAYGLEKDVSSIVEDLFPPTSGLSVIVGANANAHSGGATVSVAGSAVGGADGLVLPDPDAAPTAVNGRLVPLVTFGEHTLGGAGVLVGQATGTVVTTGTGAVENGLDLVKGTSVSLNAVAALMASL